MVDLLDRCCLLVANASAVIHLRSCLKGSSYVRSAGAPFQLSNVPTVDPNFNKKGKHMSTKREYNVWNFLNGLEYFRKYIDLFFLVDNESFKISKGY